jgi:hypothetical protein
MTAKIHYFPRLFDFFIVKSAIPKEQRERERRQSDDER